MEDIFVPVWGIAWVGTALVQKALSGAIHLPCPAHHLNDAKCPQCTDLPLLLSTSMNSPWGSIRCLSVVYSWMPGISLLYLFFSYCSKSSGSWKFKKIKKLKNFTFLLKVHESSLFHPKTTEEWQEHWTCNVTVHLAGEQIPGVWGLWEASVKWQMWHWWSGFALAGFSTVRGFGLF